MKLVKIKLMKYLSKKIDKKETWLTKMHKIFLGQKVSKIRIWGNILKRRIITHSSLKNTPFCEGNNKEFSFINLHFGEELFHFMSFT